ncbi:MAG: UDP-N-acetylmuramoyl-L-alanyl-D-glutamate--2,6-diaminopimelate ligase [Gemmatimonadaceae bacterium]|nr:UDP-N-acetylmuramoyl-L-alanyl-D-glutamate--2,6-diaminopimelate ligase [Gemmatimonadaceae bacterium]
MARSTAATPTVAPPTVAPDSGVAVDAIVRALREGGELVDVVGELPPSISGITDDSRAVTAGALFVAVRGSARDGHDFLDGASAAGAAVAIVEDASRTALPRLVVRDARRGAAIAAAAFHHDPCRSLSIVGVTGTSGKTTTVSMLRHLLDAPEAPAASIGTLGVLVGSEGTAFPGGSGLTTPGPVEFQRVLRALVDAGVRRVAMEVSSHALDQRRVEGVPFDAAVFTNLSRDHLDYHGTPEAYFEAKARLVTQLAPGGAAVVNDDVETWRALPVAPRLVRYGLHSVFAEVRANDVAVGPGGSEWTLATPDGSAEVRLPLIGDFNVSNALGAAAAAWALGLPVEQVAERLSTLPQVPGRLERVLDAPAVLRDYAHKPDALERALAAVRPFTAGRLIVVFGCGGDRDRGKRPIMGEIAERLADVVILTSDNPRTEDPERILDEIELGMHRPHERIEDRRMAIARALTLATAGDVVMLAGKGHETYQLRGTTYHPFDEKAIVRELAGHARGASEGDR